MRPRTLGVFFALSMAWCATPSSSQASVGKISIWGRYYDEVLLNQPLIKGYFGEGVVRHSDVNTLSLVSKTCVMEGLASQSSISNAASQEEVSGNATYTSVFEIFYTMAKCCSEGWLQWITCQVQCLPRHNCIAIPIKKLFVCTRMLITQSANRLVVKTLSIGENESRTDEYSNSRRVTKVGDLVRCIDQYTGPNRVNCNIVELELTNGDPWTLLFHHLVKLPLHGLGLRLHSVRLTMGIACQACQIDDSVFEIGCVSGVPVGEIGHDERSYLSIGVES